jgi:fibrillarin-like rRNA methylase
VPALKISISVNNYGDKIYAHKLHQYISNVFKILLPLDLEPYDEVKYIVPARNN